MLEACFPVGAAALTAACPDVDWEGLHHRYQWLMACMLKSSYILWGAVFCSFGIHFVPSMHIKKHKHEIILESWHLAVS